MAITMGFLSFDLDLCGALQLAEFASADDVDAAALPVWPETAG